MKLIIAGNRNLVLPPETIHDELHRWDYWLSFLHTRSTRTGEGIEIVSGKARGVDAAGEEYAKLKGYPVKPFPADWDSFGKAAGHIRNEEMGRYADAAILFFKKQPSPGTSNMLAWMAILKKPCHVVVL